MITAAHLLFHKLLYFHSGKDAQFPLSSTHCFIFFFNICSVTIFIINYQPANIPINFQDSTG
jgi:hypothetical protein